jgi:hypothetical protein
MNAVDTIEEIRKLLHLATEALEDAVLNAQEMYDGQNFNTPAVRSTTIIEDCENIANFAQKANELSEQLIGILGG